MPTTVTSSIGSGGGRDYATINAWLAACPSNLVTADQIWKGELYNDSEFLVTSGTAVDLDPLTVTTDSTRYVWLTAAAGQSFVDHANAATAPLRYDQSLGVGIRVTSSYQRLIHSGAKKLRVDRIQFYWDTAYSSNYYPPFDFGGSGCSVSQFILEVRRTSVATILLNNDSVFLANGVICFRGSGFTGQAIAFRSTNGVASGLAIVYDTALGSNAGSVAFASVFGNYGTVRNCAVFGFAEQFGGTLGSWTASNNATDGNGTYMAGSSNQLNLAATSVFENATDATRDWRPKAGGALIANGVRDQTYTNDLDIIGAARSTTTPTIGAREFASGGGGGEILLLTNSGKVLRTNSGKILRLAA